MQIHHVTGKSLKDALLRARQAYGEEAVVIHQEVVAGGGVALAVTRRRPRTPAVGAGVVEDPRLREVDECLRRSGTSRALREKVLTDIASEPASEEHVLDQAAAAIGRIARFAHLPRVRTATRVIAFAGASGVGKTTSIIKLALRFVSAGRRVELATLDGRRIGALGELRAHASRLGIPLHVVPDGGIAVAASLCAAPGLDAVLIDTAGEPHEDAARLHALRTSFKSVPVVFDVFAVLSAASRASANSAVLRELTPLTPSACVVTKLDETREPAGVLEQALNAGLALAFLSNGRDLVRHFQRADAEKTADLFLRGKLA